MRTFADKTGTLWTIDLTSHCLRRIQSLTAFNLTLPMEQDENGVVLVDRLYRNLFEFVDVLFAALADQAKEFGVSDEEFGRRMAPDVVREARDAFWEELKSFFLLLGQAETAEAIQGILDLNAAIRVNATERARGLFAEIQNRTLKEINAESEKLLAEIRNEKTTEIEFGT